MNCNSKYFSGNFKVDNREGAVEFPFKVYAFKDNGYKMEERTITVPKADESFTYDLDGNLLTHNGWTYTWNGENRLIKAEKGVVKLEFNYDYMGRRFEKKVYENGVLTKHEKYIYDGFKQIACYTANGENTVPDKFYSWLPTDLDVPLWVHNVSEGDYAYHTDANKNIRALYNADGAIAAEYDYDPFGNVTSLTGDAAEINSFRFSSEFHDAETNLVYYNYRYYDSALGRWLNRDPIEEEGGANLYGFVRNNAIIYWDLRGLAHVKIRPIEKGMAGIAFYGFGAIASHYQLYFDDGKSPMGIGYGGDDADDNGKKLSVYQNLDHTYFDDELMRSVATKIKSLPDWNGVKNKYDTATHNCQHYIAATQKEYEKALRALPKVKQFKIECDKKIIETYWKNYFTKRGLKSKEKAYELYRSGKMKVNF